MTASVAKLAKTTETQQDLKLQLDQKDIAGSQEQVKINQSSNDCEVESHQNRDVLRT